MLQCPRAPLGVCCGREQDVAVHLNLEVFLYLLLGRGTSLVSFVVKARFWYWLLMGFSEGSLDQTISQGENEW